ncbi:MAG TPA: biotin carboxyl carrier protein [Candidatus Limnocylindria bacterium]|nr:biotin carboxyl carrier protein [Candidatus Limnocylindria bacterium]
MTTDGIRFVDTTIRDGHQSLWAESMTTGMMLPVAEAMDRAGFDAIELISSSHLKKCVRELKEDPWARVKLVSQRIKNTPLRLNAGRFSAFDITPRSMYRLFMERMAANGIREARISEEWNELEGWEWKTKVSRDVGINPVLNIIYSVSPKHTDDYFAERTRQAASLKVNRLCLKDPGGLLTPERVQTLVPIVFANANGIPVELHTHCTTGLGPLCCLEAVKLGIKIVNTALPPLADGSSNPSLFNVAKNLRALGYQTLIDEELLKPVSDHFTYIAKREGFPIGAPVEYDYSQYQHQVPGGMISNLRFQLKKVGLENKIDQALEETMQVRAELGYPIMVTPLSQFVGSQAAINVIVGERYKEVTDQIIQYALGYWGKEGAELMAPEVKAKILDRPRAKEWAGRPPPEPSVAELRKKMHSENVSDEDFLLRWNLEVKEIEEMKAAGAPKEYLTASQPLVKLIDALSQRKDYRQIVIQKGEMVVSLQRDAAT